MSRYIDANKLKDGIRKRWIRDWRLSSMLAYIDHVPTEDVQEVKHGHWVIAWDGEIICSVCRAHNPVRLMQNFPFCPYCGSKLDEKEEHEKVSFDKEEEK